MDDNGTNLFRNEALQARRVRLEGAISLSRPVGAHAVVVLLVCTVGALLFWVGSGRYTRIASVRGVLATEAESARIIALRPGVVLRLVAQEGQYVRRGQELVTVQTEQQYADGLRVTQEELAVIQSQQRLAQGQVVAAQKRARSERDRLAETIANDRQQHADLESQVVIQERLLESLQRIVDRYRPVAEKGLISKTEMDRREQELLSAQQGLLRLQQQMTSLRGDEAKALTELNRSRADEDGQVAVVRSSIEGFRSQQSLLRGQQSYILIAPVDGIVTALQTGVGRTVDASLPLMTIVPRHAAVHADLYAPSRAIGFVKPGQQVRLLYDAFPYEHFGSYPGRIRAVSRVALDPRQIDGSFKTEEPVYRVTVIPDRQTVSGFGEDIALQPGMTLSANIVLERRSLLQWLLEPLRAVAKRDR